MPDPTSASRSQSGRVARAVWRQLIQRVYPRLDGTPALEGQPFPADYPMVPYARSKRFGWTHYGVMIPDLPAPHRFFSVMSIIGTPGALAFDTDHARIDTPRRSATLVSGTAATHPAHFGGYSIERDCDIADDGKLIRFGSEVEIQGGYPVFRVSATYAGLRLSIALHATDKVTWFLKTPVYDHLSLLCEYEGTLEYQGGRTIVAGLCTYEYAACPSPYLLRDKPLAPRAKLPLDFFTYQIINLAEDGLQLLLTQVRVAGTLALNKVYVRGIDEYTHTWRDADVSFEVAQYRDPPERTPDGRRMALPELFTWSVQDSGREMLRIEAVADTPYTYGLGSGYVGGYRYEGRFRGRPIGGRGYIEYIDRRDEKPRRSGSAFAQRDGQASHLAIAVLENHMGATSPSSHRLLSATGAAPVSFSYDGAGNVTQRGALAFTYNPANRLAQVSTNGNGTGSYTYDSRGHRALKSTASGATVFHYDTSGRLIAETSTSGTPLREYVYLDARFILTPYRDVSKSLNRETK